MKALYSGIISIVAGISTILYGILPHYYQLAVNRNILAHAPPGPVNLPAMIAVPPINYPLIALGSVLIGLGVYLIMAGIRKKQSGTSSRKAIN